MAKHIKEIFNKFTANVKEYKQCPPAILIAILLLMSIVTSYLRASTIKYTILAIPAVIVITISLVILIIAILNIPDDTMEMCMETCSIHLKLFWVLAIISALFILSIIFLNIFAFIREKNRKPKKKEEKDD